MAILKDNRVDICCWCP